MPNLEIDEVELQRLRRLDSTVNTLLGNPKTRRKVLESVQVAFPQQKIPELEAEDAHLEPITAVQKEVKELREQLAAEKAENEKNNKLASITSRIEEGKQRLRQQGYTDEGIAAIDKIMNEQGIVNVEIAAAYHEKQHPPAQIATPSGSGAWNFTDSVTDGEVDLKKLMDTRGESASLTDKMARDALNEIRNSRR